MTPFEIAKQKVEDGTIIPPTIMYGNKRIDAVVYQLIAHKFYLGLMVKGLKNRQVSFTQIKKFYGLKGRTAADIWPGFMKIYEENIGA